MHDTDFSQRVTLAIKERDVSPKPRWSFVAWNAAFLFLAFLTILLGALTVATFAYLVADRDWDVYREVGSRNAFFTLRSLPYLWLAALMVLVAATYAAFTRTRRGYRFAPVTILGGSVLASLALGSGMYVVGAGSRTHELARHVPAYETLVIAPDRFWDHPDSGFLAGTVVTTSTGQFFLDDGRGTLWQVSVADAALMLEGNARVRVIGMRTGERAFAASSVRPWQRQVPAVATSSGGMKEI